MTETNASAFVSRSALWVQKSGTLIPGSDLGPQTSDL